MSVVDFSFPHRFACEVLEELPGTGYRPYYFPSRGEGGRDGIILRVTPKSGKAWVGLFAFGTFGNVGLNRVLSLPAEDKLSVVARGAGYIVSVSRPDEWEEIPAIPVIDVRSAVAAGVVVFATHTDMLAYGQSGLKWRTKRLSWDGLRIVAVGDRILVGQYWDIPTEATQTFEVDLETGTAHGGVE